MFFCGNAHKRTQKNIYLIYVYTLIFLEYYRKYIQYNLLLSSVCSKSGMDRTWRWTIQKYPGVYLELFNFFFLIDKKYNVYVRLYNQFN